MLVKSDDDQARSESEYSIVEAQPDSVLSERTLLPRRAKVPAMPTKRAASPRSRPASAKNAALPDHLQPQLATLVDAPPAGDWHYEVKYK